MEKSTINSFIEEHAQKAPESPAIWGENRKQLNYLQLHKFIQHTNHTLNKLGIGREDPVAIVLPNGPEMATAFLSVASSAIAAPLNPSYQSQEYLFYLKDLNAKALIVHKGMDTPAVEVAESLKIPILWLHPDINGFAGEFQLEGNSNLNTALTGTARSEDIALILHTSGTTSKPKMVPLKHRNICISAKNISKTLHLSPTDRCLNIMPLFHIHGLIAAVLASISAGANIFCSNGFVATKFFDWVECSKPTWYTAVPTMHQSILSRSKANLKIIAKTPFRFIRSSSSSLAPRIMSDLEKVFHCPVIEAYGMTEAAHQMASNPLPPAERKPGSVGLPAGPMIEIMEEDGENIHHRGETGEIVVKGPNIISGYLENPDANQRSFTNGWFRTGDQGYKDKDGYLYISGRLKEIINRGGEKISPREVDEVLLSHPDVKQVVTFSIPNEILGEEVGSAVISQNPDLSSQKLQQFASKKLAIFKIPTTIVFLDEIPKGPTGKLQRIGLAEKLGLITGDSDPGHIQTPNLDTPGTPLEAALMEIWCEVLNIDSVGVNEPFIDAGGDSVLAALLHQRIRDKLDVSIELIDLYNAPTIKNQATLLIKS